MSKLEVEEKKVVTFAEQNQKLQKQKDDAELQLRELSYKLDQVNSELSESKLTAASLKNLFEKKQKNLILLKRNLKTLKLQMTI